MLMILNQVSMFVCSMGTMPNLPIFAGQPKLIIKGVPALSILSAVLLPGLLCNALPPIPVPCIPSAKFLLGSTKVMISGAPAAILFGGFIMCNTYPIPGIINPIVTSSTVSSR